MLIIYIAGQLIEAIGATLLFLFAPNHLPGAWIYPDSRLILAVHNRKKKFLKLGFCFVIFGACTSIAYAIYNYIQIK